MKYTFNKLCGLIFSVSLIVVPNFLNSKLESKFVAWIKSPFFWFVETFFISDELLSLFEEFYSKHCLILWLWSFLTLALCAEGSFSSSKRRRKTKGNTTWHPSTGHWTWTSSALRRSGAPLRCASFARSKNGKEHDERSIRRRTTDATKGVLRRQRLKLDRIELPMPLVLLTFTKKTV